MPLDEPTTGLHFEDVRKLLEVLQELVDSGNTVIVIEHNLDVIKVADWIVDLGPDGGDGSGRIVAVGTPEEVSENPESHTGRFLKETFVRHAERKAEQRSKLNAKPIAQSKPTARKTSKKASPRKKTAAK